MDDVGQHPGIGRRSARIGFGVDQLAGEIGQGLLILVCAMQGDDAGTPARLAEKIAKLRIFKDAASKSALVISMVRISISFAFQEMGPCASPGGAYGP